MILENFRELIRAYVPAAKINVVDNTLLDLLINKGVDDVNQDGACYVGNSTFNVVAEQADYVMSTVIPDFFAFDVEGLWWNDGTAASPDWKRLDSITMKTLSNQFIQWRNEGSDSPLRCVLEGDDLLIQPTPDTDLDNGFWAYFIKKAVWMTNANHYPFSGSAVEIGTLSVLDDAIIDYVRWKLAIPLKHDQVGIVTEEQYKKTRAEKIALLKRRLDFTGNPDMRMRIPHVRNRTHQRR